MSYSHIIVYITVPSRDVGEQIARTLVEKNLAACVNISPGICSIYKWQGEINQDNELLLIAKTRTSLFEQLETTVKQLHPYDVPEVIGTPIIMGSNKFLTWINVETA